MWTAIALLLPVIVIAIIRAEFLPYKTISDEERREEETWWRAIK